MGVSEADAQAWLHKAEQDLAAARALSAGESPLWDIVVYHAQQAAEKYLKALLVRRAIQPPRTHDLVLLLTLCVATAPGLVGLADDCAFLSPLAVLSRYPGDGPETAAEDGERALRIAGLVRSEVMALMTSDDTTGFPT